MLRVLFHYIVIVKKFSKSFISDPITINNYSYLLLLCKAKGIHALIL